MAIFTSGSPGVMPTPAEQVGKTNTVGRDMYDAEEERRRKLARQQQQQAGAAQSAEAADMTAGQQQAKAAQPQPPAQAQQAKPAPAQATFAELQAQGRARPAPPQRPAGLPVRPPGQPAQAAQGTAQADFLSQVQQAVGGAAGQRQQDFERARNQASTVMGGTSPQAAQQQQEIEQRIAAIRANPTAQQQEAMRLAEAAGADPMAAAMDPAQFQRWLEAKRIRDAYNAGEAGYSEMTQDQLQSVLAGVMGEPQPQPRQDDFMARLQAMLGGAEGADVGTMEAAAPTEAPYETAAEEVEPGAAPAEAFAPATAPAAAPTAATAETPPAAPPETPPELNEEEAVAAATTAGGAPPPAAPPAGGAGAPPPSAPPAASPAGVPAAVAGAPAAAAGTATGPTGAAYQTYGGSQMANELQRQLMEQVGMLRNAPSRFEDPAFKAQREAARANLEAEFGAERSRIEEEMARRGLAASSIASGRFGDLAGQQARALAGMEADILKEQARTQAEDRKLMLDTMSNLAQMAGSQSREEFMANLESMKATGQLDMMAKELMQKAQLEGRSLDLQQARDQVTAELGRGQLSLGYAEMASREGIAGRDIASRERISGQEIASREKMQLSQFGFDEKMQAKEAELKEKLQNNQITADERRQLAELDARKQEAQKQRDFEMGESEKQRAFTGTEAEKSRQWQAEQAKLDRDLKELFGMADLSGFYKDPTTGKLTPTAGQRQQQQQFLGQVATVLAGMDPKKRDEFLRDQPEIRKLLGMDGGAKTGGGAGGYYGGGAVGGVDTSGYGGGYSGGGGMYGGDSGI